MLALWAFILCFPVIQTSCVSLSTERLSTGLSYSRSGEVAIAMRAPGPSDLAAAAREGFRTALDLREAHEIEGPAPTAEGILRYSLPVRVGAIEGTLVSRFRSMLEMAPKPVLVYCTHGQRAAAMWALARIQDGVSPEAALRDAREVGLHYGPLIRLIESKGRIESTGF